jgi:hypothetical protein
MTWHQDPLASPRQPNKSLLVLFFRKEQKRKTLLFLKKKKQKDFYSLVARIRAG